HCFYRVSPTTASQFLSFGNWSTTRPVLPQACACLARGLGARCLRCLAERCFADNSLDKSPERQPTHRMGTHLLWDRRHCLGRVFFLVKATLVGLLGLVGRTIVLTLPNPLFGRCADLLGHFSICGWRCQRAYLLPVYTLSLCCFFTARSNGAF